MSDDRFEPVEGGTYTASDVSGARTNPFGRSEAMIEAIFKRLREDNEDIVAVMNQLLEELQSNPGELPEDKFV